MQCDPAALGHTLKGGLHVWNIGTSCHRSFNVCPQLAASAQSTLGSLGALSGFHDSRANEGTLAVLLNERIDNGRDT